MVPYLLSVKTVPDRLPAERAFPFNLHFVETLHLKFRTPVTFLVGENGSGKSTLLEGIAALCRLPVSGGSRNELADKYGPETDSTLANVLRPAFRKQPGDGFFLRAEFAAHFASLLDEQAGGHMYGLAFERYGGQSLHTRSHGEAFLAILQNRIRRGLFLFDEPESALSPQRQLALLALMTDLVKTKEAQFIVATHSPILLTFPGASIVNFDDSALPEVALEETAHYRITRGILDDPERYWRHLR
ncbi:MAG: AAA family ATPase [Bryobacteraceae bacterium]